MNLKVISIALCTSLLFGCATTKCLDSVKTEVIERILVKCKKGEKHGRQLIYFKDGSKYKSHWKKGVLHGKYVQYYTDGRVLSKGRYINGKLDWSIDYLLSPID